MKTRWNPLAVIVITFALLGVGCSSGAAPQSPTQSPPVLASPSTIAKAVRDTHENLNGVLWMQTSAEHRIACQTVFDSAKTALDAALKDPAWTAALEQTGSFGALPPAIVVDLDETVLDNSPFYGRLVADRIGFEYKLWQEWVARAEATAVPGGLDFLKYAESKGVTIFYVTNRDTNMEAATRTNLKKLGLTLTSTVDTVLMNGERSGWSSDKSSRRAFIATTYRILLLVGDDLGDFVSGANDTSENRVALADRYSDLWSKRWFLLPNPVSGSWESAFYGNASYAADDFILSAKLKKVNSFRTPTDSAATPAVVAAAATVSFVGGNCSYAGPKKIPYGEFIIDWIAEDQSYKGYGIAVSTLDEGKTFQDLDAWPYTDQPPWLTVLAFFETKSGTHTQVSATVGRGPIFLVCFTGPPPNDRKVGTLGPIEVGE